jgi:hypothetical protein
MATHKLAILAHLATNGGTYGSPTWANAASVLDAAMNLAWDPAEASSRASRLKMFAKAMADLEVTAKVKVSDAADYDTLYGASIGDTALDLLVLDGPYTVEGSLGFRVYFQVFTKNQDQAASNVIYDEFTLKPSPGANAPKTAEVGSGGSITYTAI